VTLEVEKMRKTHDNDSIRWRQIVICLCLTAAFVCGSAAKGIAQEVTDSPAPILISEINTTRALAVDAANWRGNLPKTGTPFFNAGADSRVVIFVTNLDLLKDEGANAFRVYAEDVAGKKYRLKVESIQPLGKQNWIYGLIIQLYDPDEFNGQLTNTGDVLLNVTWRGMTSNRVRLGLGSTGGKIRDDEGAVPTPAPSAPPSRNIKNVAYNTGGDRSRFMEQAAFGPTAALDLRLKQIGLQRWINEQFNKQPTFPYPDMPQRSTDTGTGCPMTDPNPNCVRDIYSQYQNQNWMFKEALYGDDQLRRRVSWALSQIWVVSGVDTQQSRWLQEYYKILDRNAFGNYRNLMAEMTLNPAMGNYLDMIRSTRTNPNENYPREIMQLFTIGLVMLNQDGTPILDGNGNPIPTYDQDKVTNFTKVFTGWSGCNSAPPTCPNATPGVPNYIDPMLLNANNHDLTAKSLLNYTQVNGQPAPFPTIAACSNCTTVDQKAAYANASLSQTLDNIFYHPNVGPFVAHLLIQHLVTSDPSPAYVQRVAAAFNDNGMGVRGDMKAVITAILLDPEARGSRKTAPTYGKLREPFQFATNLLRQFNARSADGTQLSDGYINPQTTGMGQNIWNSPTVFNYFPPDYGVPGTTLVAPEFGLLNSGTSFARINFVNTMVYSRINCTGGVPNCQPTGSAPFGTSISLAEPTAWAQADIAAGDTNFTQTIEGFNRKMLYGNMSAAMKAQLQTALQAIPANTANRATVTAQQALYLVASSSQYQVQK
jgi:uncharacterized protein (DUF1800 family)